MFPYWKGHCDTQSKFKGGGGVLSDILNVESEKAIEPNFQYKRYLFYNQIQRKGTIWQLYGPKG